MMSVFSAVAGRAASELEELAVRRQFDDARPLAERLSFLA
jgi:hypothetical protein